MDLIKNCQGEGMKTNISPSLKKVTLLSLLLAALFPSLSFGEVSLDTNGSFTLRPINLTGNDVAPLVMMNVSRDHQLSYKAYNDFSDLDNDGEPEKTYKDSIEYYGYFDSKKCYVYNNEPFRAG